jgi:hypothetical protein
MDRISGMIAQPLVVERDTDMAGMVAGDVTVRSGRLLRLGGMVRGDIILEPGARLEMSGIVSGRVIRR